MHKTLLAASVSALVAGFAGPATAQADKSAPAARAVPADVAASNNLRAARRHIAKRDGANATGRDLSDGSAPLTGSGGKKP